ncbi:MAG: glycosyltransferase family 2 protein [Rhodobacteraceae bacterium]|nr:glycosyltransferase family 2 protein [Paracoccaceae bacterium]
MSRVSCIIPAWNAARYLPEAVASVQAQSRPVDEIIVVDDGSTDDTAKVAASLPNVRLICQKNSGVGAARNAGITAATGDFLAFNDADDLWTPDKIALQMAAFEADPTLDLCFAMMEHRDIRPAAPDAPKLALPQGIVPGKLVANMLARASVFDRVGLFSTSMRTSLEQEWLLQVRDAGLKAELLPQLTLVRRIHGENMTLRLDREKREDYMKMLQKVLRARRAAGKTVEPRETWKANDTDA